MTQGTLCFCNSNRAWGGGERWHLEAARAMAARGFTVLVMADEHSPLLERAQRCPELHTHALRFSSLAWVNPMTLLRTAAVLKKHMVTSLVLGLPIDLKTAGLAGRLAGVTRIYYRRGSALPVRDSYSNRFLYGSLLTGLIVNSQETARLTLVNNPQLIPAQRIHLLPNGIDAHDFDSALAAAAPVFRPQAQNPAPCIIGNAGRLTRQKGQKYLLHMSRHLSDASFAHRLVLAGDGELAEELYRLARQLDVEKQVVFAGFLADMAPFWKSIDLFVLSSLWEGFGYVLAEAMLARKATLAFNANSMPELIVPGLTGQLIPLPEENEADSLTGARLAQSVLSMAGTPHALTVLGQAGRERALERYDQTRCMDKLFTLLTPE